MRSLSFVSITLGFILLHGCASGPAIRVDKDPAANLSSYTTFGFFERAATDQPQYSSIVTARLREATRIQLERRGYVYDERAPQLRVNFFLNIKDRQEVRTSPSAGGFYHYRAGLYGGLGGLPTVDTVQYKAGTLSIDLVDAQRKSLVWQGLAEGKVASAAYNSPGPAIDRVVGQIFTAFPMVRPGV